MSLVKDVIVNGRKKEPLASNLPRRFTYPFFLIHMLGFGLSGFLLAYAGEPQVLFLYFHGGLAITVYLIFYVVIFGVDKVKWMLINALLGVFGLYGEIRALLSLAGKDISDFPFYVHVIPFLYYVLYTFLLRQLFIEITGSRGDEKRAERVSYIYVALSIGVSAVTFFAF